MSVLASTPVLAFFICDLADVSRPTSSRLRKVLPPPPAPSASASVSALLTSLMASAGGDSRFLLSLLLFGLLISLVRIVSSQGRLLRRAKGSLQRAAVRAWTAERKRTVRILAMIYIGRMRIVIKLKNQKKTRLAPTEHIGRPCCTRFAVPGLPWMVWRCSFVLYFALAPVDRAIRYSKGK